MRSRMRGCRAGQEHGSIVLEASLVLPVFLFFILFFIYMVQMTLISTALQNAASEMAKQVASSIYPVSLAIGAAEGAAGTIGQVEIVPSLTIEELAAEFGSTLPEPAATWVEEAIVAGKKPLEQLRGEVSEAVMDPVMKPLLKPFIEDTILDYERIHITGVVVPGFEDGGGPYFKIELSYVLPMKVPFIYRDTVLQAAAEERLWIGDTGEGAGDGSSTDPGAASDGIQIISKPEPAIKGIYNTIKAQIAPGESANLSIIYKSGSSTAKHIGWTQADAQGMVEWNWFVGTNTTPGIWTFVIETESGQHIEVQFEVVEKNTAREGV
ncbi:pilus assembly protein [Paenibacillus sp. P96]|uniref:Pilus assembly protein n=1 Tax=Paenibacillus zeirhizosphaerae TaxID=2987519 RepID=A0ABT9FVW9_9BACL|nr:TadE/TadG family type IV pilus assembly protein [Paenibacillus sp. P96]MDP4098869.1 pilus assembly protein [Paenibacillus sp. P96]